MSYMHAGYVASLLLLATACADQPAAAFQEEPAKTPKATPKSGNKKAAGRDLITVQFKIALEGENAISLPSSVELKASEPDCEKLDRTGDLNAEGLVTISKVPACKTAVWIFITGLDSKVVLVDLAKYKDKSAPIQILVSKQGEVTVQN